MRTKIVYYAWVNLNWLLPTRNKPGAALNTVFELGQSGCRHVFFVLFSTVVGKFVQ